MLHILDLESLERRIIFDYEKYGNSPSCIGKDKFIPNQIALQQGAGLTEKDELEGLQDVKVKIIQNEECYAKIESAPPRIIRNQFMKELPEGINDGMLCTLGIENEDGVIQVGILSWFSQCGMGWLQHLAFRQETFQWTVGPHSKLSSIYHMPDHVKKYTKSIRPMVRCKWIK